MSVAELDRTHPPSPPEVRPFTFPAIERFSLRNELPVLFARTEGIPVATMSLLVPSGATREHPSRAGLAKMTAALLESGAGALGAAEISRRLEALGVRLHSGTAWEISHIDFTALAEKLGDAGELMALLARAPAFPAEEVERIRGEQLASILQRRSEPRGFANQLIDHFIFAERSPFSRPIGGTAEKVQKLTVEDVRSFHAATYTPRGAGLVIVGAIDSARARRIAEDAFGDWAGGTPVEGDSSISVRFDRPAVVIVDRPGAVQSEIRVGHLGVQRHTPDYFPLLVMNTILGGAFSSRLNMNLRERHGFTYGARSSFAMRRRPGPFVVSTAVQTEVTAAAIGEILAEMRRITEGPVTEAELQDARQYVAGTFPLLLETTDGIASRLAELFIYDLPDSYLEEFAERVLAVTAEEVQAAARSHVRPGAAVVLVLGDASRLRDDLATLDLAPVDVLDPATLP